MHPDAVFRYVGSTDSMTHRRANTKSKIISLVDGGSDRAGTGLENHFKNGCSGYCGADLKHVRVTLLENMNLTEDDLKTSVH